MSGGEHSRLRAALGGFMTGVTIVTTRDADGQPRGMTANSFSSVSLSPPLVSICIGRGAGSFSAFAECDGFAVNVLSEEHGDLAAVFAARGVNRFASGKWREGRGGMILEDAVAWLDCESRAKYDGGDHLILVGCARDFGDAPRPPLGFFRGRFFTPGMERDLSAEAATENGAGRVGAGRVGVGAGVGAGVGVVLENEDGDILLVEKNGAVSVPAAARRRGLERALEELGAEGARVEFLFAVFENTDGGVSVFYRGTARGTAAKNGGRFFSSDDIPWPRMSAAECAMLRRYLHERAGARFGVYAGDHQSGDVRPLAQ